MIERLVKAAVSAPAEVMPDTEVTKAIVTELLSLRDRMTELTGSLVSSRDGILIVHDLPQGIEPTGMAALSASELALSQRIALTAHEGPFEEVVVRNGGGFVVVYSAGPTAVLTVLAPGEVNLGRLHLESRPVAGLIAELFATAETEHPPTKGR